MTRNIAAPDCPCLSCEVPGVLDLLGLTGVVDGGHWEPRSGHGSTSDEEEAPQEDQVAPHDVPSPLVEAEDDKEDDEHGGSDLLADHKDHLVHVEQICEERESCL